MRLKVTLARSSGRNDDITITTDAAASVADVAASIAQVDPYSELPDTANGRELTLRVAAPGRSEWLLLPPDAPVGEARLGSGSSIALADAGMYYAPRAGESAAMAMVHILTGPDAGTKIPLTRGTAVIGRGQDCDIALTDRLVSKRHVRLEVSSVVDVVDLGSANGLIVDGGLIARLRIEHSEVLFIGDSSIRITMLDTAISLGDDYEAGPVLFNRSPRVETRYSGESFTSPDVPTEHDDQPFPWLAMVAPVVLGVSMWLLFNRPAALLFVLMSPMMLVGNFYMTKSKDKRMLAKAIGRFEDRISVLAARLGSEREIERETRLGESPATVASDDDDALSWSERHAYEQENDDLVRDRVSAEQVMEAAVRLLQQAIDHRDAAATTASSAIREVENSGDLNDSFWDNVDQFFEENGELIDQVLFYAGLVAAALVVIALFVPGLNLIVLAVAVIVTTATILNATGQALTGNKSWTEAVLEIGLALIPFGVGRVIGRGASAVHAATSSAAVTSVMRSAAGRGISGVTRAVGVQSVIGVARAGYPRVLVGSDVRLLAEIRAMAGIRLASGTTSEFVARTARPGSALLGAWAVNEVGVPIGSVFVPSLLPKNWVKDTTHTVQDTKW